MIPGFAPGSVVATYSGPKPIELVAAGSKVLSRLAHKTVRYTDTEAGPRRAVRRSDGRILVGHMNALAWTRSRGWVPLWALAEGDVLSSDDGSNVTVSSVSDLPAGETHGLSVERDRGYFCGGTLVR